MSTEQFIIIDTVEQDAKVELGEIEIGFELFAYRPVEVSMDMNTVPYRIILEEV